MYWAGAEAIYATPGTYAGVWLPAGIYLAWLMRTPPRQWGAVIVTAAVANLLADLMHHQPLWFAGGFLVVNVGAPLAAAALLVRFCRPMLSFAQLQHVMYLGLFVGLLSGPIAALAGTALLVARRGGDFWQEWFLFWIGDLVGLLLAMPLRYRAA